VGINVGVASSLQAVKTSKTGISSQTAQDNLTCLLMILPPNNIGLESDLAGAL
jgi:hypothetical protein